MWVKRARLAECKEKGSYRTAWCQTDPIEFFPFDISLNPEDNLFGSFVTF